eukprot:12536949-Alexandrium_andersonii.AAC.1
MCVVLRVAVTWLKELDARSFRCLAHPGSPGMWRGPTGRCVSRISGVAGWGVAARVLGPACVAAAASG